jgi:hypothetical protein
MRLYSSLELLLDTALQVGDPPRHPNFVICDSLLEVQFLVFALDSPLSVNSQTNSHVTLLVFVEPLCALDAVVKKEGGSEPQDDCSKALYDCFDGQMRNAALLSQLTEYPSPAKLESVIIGPSADRLHSPFKPSQAIHLGQCEGEKT